MSVQSRPLPSQWSDQGCTVRVLDRTGDVVLAERIRKSGKRDSYEVFRVNVSKPHPRTLAAAGESGADMPDVECYPTAAQWGTAGLSITDEVRARDVFARVAGGQTFRDVSRRPAA